MSVTDEQIKKLQKKHLKKMAARKRSSKNFMPKWI